MKKIMRSGFTLVELIMVIAILAIISTLAVSKYGNLRNDSARKVSLANQIHINQVVDTYMAANNGGLDKLDALIDYTTGDGTPGSFAGKYGEALNETASIGGIYRGLKINSNEAAAKKNQGIHSRLAEILCVYYLTAADVVALEKLGLRNVNRHWVNATEAPGASGVTGEDGSYPMIANGLDPSASGAILTSNQAGRAVAAINIAAGSTDEASNLFHYKRGARIYQEMGADITLKQESSNYQQLEDALTPGVLLAFGLGDNASLVGKSEGGLVATPVCEYLETKYYRNYLLLVRLLPASGSYGKETAEFVGVLDPEGNTPASAKQLLK